MPLRVADLLPWSIEIGRGGQIDISGNNQPLCSRLHPFKLVAHR